MTGWDVRRGPPAGTVPVVVPGDLVARAVGLAVWAGAVTVYREGFAFTVLTLADTRRVAPPAPWALDVPERDRMTWLTVGYADGRSRAADLNANTPRRQPRGPHVSFLNGSGSDGRDESRWWVTPLPPPGPVTLAIHLNGQRTPTSVGNLDGGAIAHAAASAETRWPEPPGR